MPTYEDNLAIVSVALTHAVGLQPCMITFAVDYSGAAGTPEDNLNTILDGFADELSSRIDNSVTIGPVIALFGLGNDAPLEAQSTDTNRTGSRSMNSVPPNICLLVKKTTGVIGRRNRGRMYFPWVIDESGLDEAGHDAGDAAALQVEVTDWLERLTADSLPMVIANREYDLPWNTPADRHLVAVTMGPTVTNLTVDPLIASQRRRLGR